MARIPLQNPASATGSNKQIFDHLQKALGVVPNLSKALGNSPAALQAFAGFNGALAGAKLSGTTRELIALLTAEENSCNYCLSAHTVLGKGAGATQEQIDAARQGKSSDPKTAGALNFAKALLETRGGVSQGDVDAARRVGLSDAELTEVVAVVSLNIFTNFTNRAFDVDIDFPLVEAGVEARA